MGTEREDKKEEIKTESGAKGVKIPRLPQTHEMNGYQIPVKSTFG